MLKVVFLICEKMLSTSVSLPLEQLQTAASLALAQKLYGRRQKLLDVKLVSQTGKAVTCHSGLALHAHCAMSDVHDADIIFLPALWRNPLPQLRQNAEVPSWLAQHHQDGAILAGVSTGCYFLAEAGLLNYKAATTHWHYFDEFADRYPLVNLKRKYFITKAGSIYCTGSVNSLADLTIHFIQRYFSRDIANHVERHFFHEIRLAFGGSRSFIEMESAHPDEDIVRAQVWMQEHFDSQLSMTDIAARYDMSPRSFSRRFRAATGMSPLAYLQHVRMENAKELLQTSNLNIAEIMYQVGYHDARHFNALFKKAIGVTPGQYRTTVRAKMFSV